MILGHLIGSLVVWYGLVQCSRRPVRYEFDAAGSDLPHFSVVDQLVGSGANRYRNGCPPDSAGYPEIVAPWWRYMVNLSYRMNYFATDLRHQAQREKRASRVAMASGKYRPIYLNIGYIGHGYLAGSTVG